MHQMPGWPPVVNRTARNGVSQADDASSVCRDSVKNLRSRADEDYDWKKSVDHPVVRVPVIS